MKSVDKLDHQVLNERGGPNLVVDIFLWCLDRDLNSFEQKIILITSPSLSLDKYTDLHDKGIRRGWRKRHKIQACERKSNHWYLRGSIYDRSFWWFFLLFSPHSFQTNDMIFPLTVNNDTRNEEIDIRRNHNNSPTNRRQQIVHYFLRLFRKHNLWQRMQS